MSGQEAPEDFAEQADSPSELAARLRTGSDGLARTLRRFNQSAEKGEKPESGRGQYVCATPPRIPGGRRGEA